jgi:hypothetical protein
MRSTPPTARLAWLAVLGMWGQFTYFRCNQRDLMNRFATVAYAAEACNSSRPDVTLPITMSVGLNSSRCSMIVLAK